MCTTTALCCLVSVCVLVIIMIIWWVGGCKKKHKKITHLTFTEIRWTGIRKKERDSSAFLYLGGGYIMPSFLKYLLAEWPVAAVDCISSYSGHAFLYFFGHILHAFLFSWNCKSISRWLESNHHHHHHWYLLLMSVVVVLQ